MKTSDINLLNNFRILFKGRPNTRKTVSYASFPGKHYVFLFDPLGLNPIKKHWPERADIEYDVYNNSNLQDADQKMKALVANNPYQNVTIDSLTFAADASMQYGIKSNTSPTAKKLGFIRMPGFEEFNAENNYLLGMLSFSTLLKCNVFLTAHVLVDTVEDPNTKLVLRKRQRLLTGGKALAEKVLADFKNVWHFDEVVDTVDPRKQPSYIVRTVSVGEDIARNTIPNIPLTMDITNDFLYNVLQQNLALKGVKI